MRNRYVLAAVAILVVTVVLDALSTVLGVSRGKSVSGLAPVQPADVVTYWAFASLSVLGVLVAWARPRNVLWLLASITGLFNGLASFTFEYAIYADFRHPGAFGAAAATWVSLWSWVPASNTAPLVLLTYPTGRLVSRHWRPVVAVILAISTCHALLAALIPVAYGNGPGSGPPLVNPLGVSWLDGLGRNFSLVVFPPVAVFGALGLASVVVRYRGASGAERQQIKWLGYAGGLYALQFVLTGASSIANGGVPYLAAAGILVNIVSVVAFPIAVGIGILRYRLYDIDVVISRTLVYGALAIFISGIYVGIVVGLGSLVGSAGKPNLGLSILATAVVAVAFQPVRERLQGVANRLVYGRRASPYEVLSEFSRQVAGSFAGEEALRRMAQVLAEGTAAEQAAVYVGDRRVAEHPPGVNGGPAGEPRSVDVWHRGERLGRLEVRKRRGEHLTPLEEKLFEDLAHQAGLVLSNVGLTADLRARLEELRASRQRLVQAQDEERRRLERNLHDGAQQHLVALKVRLGLARAVAEKAPDQLPAILADLQAEADSTLATMRELAHGIYPPLLAERGLKEALESQARRATLPVTVEAEGIGRHPQEVEAAVYFCCLEALQNVQKYAQATSACLRLREAEACLTFEVADDGVGFDPATVKAGAGLANLRDRLDALGGDLVIDSHPARGTRVSGRLTVPAAAVVD